MQMCVSVSDLRTHAHARTHTHTRTHTRTHVRARTRTHARTHARTVGRPAIWRTLSGDGGPSQKAVLHRGPLHSLCPCSSLCVCVVDSFPSECVVAAPPTPLRWSRPCDVLREERERGDACHILKGALNCLCEPRRRRGGAGLSHAPEGTQSSQGNLVSRK